MGAGQFVSCSLLPCASQRIQKTDTESQIGHLRYLYKTPFQTDTEITDFKV